MQNQQMGASPRQTQSNKHAHQQSQHQSTSNLKTVLSGGGSTGKMKTTTGSFKQQIASDAAGNSAENNQQQQQVVIGTTTNNLIMSRGRPAQIDNAARAAANLHQSTTGQMNFSKTLTQHMQTQQQASVGSSGFHSSKSKVTKKTSLHNRNGSQNFNTSEKATPQRSTEALNSKLKKKKRQTLGNTSSFQNQHQHHQSTTSITNQNSRGNLLISHSNQLSYLKQSQQLQEARNHQRTDGCGAGAGISGKKSIKSNASLKTKQNVGNCAAAGGVVTNQSQTNTSQTVKNAGGAGGPTSGATNNNTMNKAMGVTVISDSSFNNMTIRSGDKYNSTLGPTVKRSTNGHKQRQIANLEHQVLQNALGHPMSAKNAAEQQQTNKHNIFQTTGGMGQVQGSAGGGSSTQNLNQSSQPRGQQLHPGHANKHYLKGGGSMIELSTATNSAQNPVVSSKATHGHTKNLSSANVFQRSHHQIYHSKNQSVGSMSYTSNNSRFTTTRPKNPTDGSLSSKGSIDSDRHFGVSTNNRLKQKLANQQQHNAAVVAQQQVVGVQNVNGGGTVGAPNVQCVSLHIDQDYLTMNKSVSPPKKPSNVGKQTTPSNATQAQYQSGKGTTSSKFNLVNRGALNNTGQFPAVVTNRTGAILSPKQASTRGTMSQSMAAQNNFMKNQPTGRGSNDFQLAQQAAQNNTSTLMQQQQQQSSKRKLSMKLSQAQLQQTNAQSQEQLQNQAILVSSQNKSMVVRGGAGQQQTDKIVNRQSNESISQKDVTSLITPKNVAEDSGVQPMQKSQQYLKEDQLSSHHNASASKTATNKTANQQDVIAEEQVEDSNQQTKRTSRDGGGEPVTSQKTLASVTSAPNLNQSTTTAKNKPTTNENGKQQAPYSKHLSSVRQQLKTQILKQSSQTQHTRSQNGELTQHSMKDIGNQSSMIYNSNPQQPSSAIGVNEVSFPMSSRQALQLFQNQGMTDYEKIEIQNYQEVYFLGLEAKKIQATSLLGHNFGFDDERGDYQVVMKDHLAYRFEVVDKLGSGSFGQALKCFDHKLQQVVAIKVIRNKKRFQHQAGVELNLLRYLKQKDKNDENNIVRVHDYAIFRKHLLLSFELLSMNLYEFIKQNNFQGVSTGLIRRFAIQILQALKFQRDHHIIHCDLKPENILLKQPNKSGIKIIDYGSSCFQNQRIYTYIQSRFYRAPEIILGIPYTTAIDMWSFGCIMAELYTGYPLFPGENEAEQLAYVMEIQGVPPDYLIELSSRRNLFFEKDTCTPIVVTNSRGRRRLPNTKTLQNVLKKCQDLKFLDFINLCLDWDPVNRMTALEALQHEWILEGLPEKVLVHHQRMFGGSEDKMNIKEACLTAVQGFPEDANTKTIYDIVAEFRADDQRRERRTLKGITPDQITQTQQKEVTPAQLQKLASVQNNNNNNGNKKELAVTQPSSKGYETVPTKTPNRSEIHQSVKNAAVTNSNGGNNSNTNTLTKHKSTIFQSNQAQSQATVKPTDSVTVDVAAGTTSTESPARHRKIIRGFQQSQSTKVLPPNPNNHQNQHHNHHHQYNSNNTNHHMVNNNNVTITSEVGGKNYQPPQHLSCQSYESSAKKITTSHRGKLLKNTQFDKSQNQTQESHAYTDNTVTEGQDFAKTPVGDFQSIEDITRIKGKAHIAKTQSQLPLKNINKLVISNQEISSQEGVVDDCFTGIAEHATENTNGNSTVNIATGSISSNNHTGSVKHIKMVLSSAEDDGVDGVGSQIQVVKEQQQVLSNEESDYEDMMTPTDDEGGASLNHTQKIPISLIKAKDKASKLFQPIPQHHQQYHHHHHQSNGSNTASTGGSNRNVAASGKMASSNNQNHHTNSEGGSNYYFAQAQQKSGGTASGQSSGKKRVQKFKVSSSNGPNHQADQMTPKQVVMISSMQPKGTSKMSVNTGTSSSQKGSTTANQTGNSNSNKVSSSHHHHHHQQQSSFSQQNRKEYQSSSQKKNQQNQPQHQHYATNRSHQMSQQLMPTNHHNDAGDSNHGTGSYSYRTNQAKESKNGVILGSSVSAAHLAAGSSGSGTKMHQSASQGTRK